MRIYRKDLIRRTWSALYKGKEKRIYTQEIVRDVINSFLDELAQATIKGESITLTRVLSIFPHILKGTRLYDFNEHKVKSIGDRKVLKCLLADEIVSEFKKRNR